jgi:hypothetical protein
MNTHTERLETMYDPELGNDDQRLSAALPEGTSMRWANVDDTGTIAPSGLPSPGLARRLIQAMAAVQPLVKDGENQFHHYRYPSVAQVRDHANKALASAGVAIIPSIARVAQRERVSGAGKSITVTAVELEIAVCSEDGAYLARWGGESDDTGDKGVQKAASAALKAFLVQLLLIGAAEPENDDGATERVRAPKSRKAAKSQPAAKSQSPAPKRPAPKRPAQHWADKSENIQAFWEFTLIKLGLGETDVLRALNVERVHDFAGTMKEAKAILEQYAEQRLNKPAQRVDDDTQPDLL